MLRRYLVGFTVEGCEEGFCEREFCHLGGLILESMRWRRGVEQVLL